MASKEFNQLVEEAGFRRDRKDRLVCPLTGKPPNIDRCYGKATQRMLLSDGACRNYCHPLFDDLKNRRFGGLSVIN